MDRHWAMVRKALRAAPLSRWLSAWSSSSLHTTLHQYIGGNGSKEGWMGTGKRGKQALTLQTDSTDTGSKGSKIFWSSLWESPTSTEEWREENRIRERGIEIKERKILNRERQIGWDSNSVQFQRYNFLKGIKGFRGLYLNRNKVSWSMFIFLHNNMAQSREIMQSAFCWEDTTESKCEKCDRERHWNWEIEKTSWEKNTTIQHQVLRESERAGVIGA